MNSALHRIAIGVIAVICFIGINGAAYAQILYGSIVGNVKDSTDAPVPGASVSITSRGTSQTRQTTTNEAGGYSFPTLLPGSYDVTVVKQGFQTVTRSGVEVTINSVSRTDVMLEVGIVAESITVSEGAAALQTDRAEVRAELQSRTLQNIPLPSGRNYQQMFVAIPGFSPPADASSIPGNPSRALQVNVNGTTSNSAVTRIDGASSTNVFMNMVSAYVPALESIETVNVVTNSFDAEQGLAGGAAINVQIKSGTNQLHGSAFEYHTNNKLKAKPFFSPPGERKAKSIMNQFGGTLGGPIRKNELFYFVSYEGTYNHQFAAKYQTVPTAAIKSGNMSASPSEIYDPRTGFSDGSGRTPFPGKQIPSSRIDPIAKKIADLTPLPTYPNLLTSNYYAGKPFYFDRNTVDSKINWNASRKLSMYGRYSFLKFDSIAPPTFGDELGGDAISGANVGHGFGFTQSLTIAATYVASPNFIVDAYFGYTLMDNHSEQSRLDEKVGLDYLGIPGTNGPRRFEGGWPRFSITNYSVLGIKDAYMPYHRHDSQSQYVANGNWTRGTHNIRFGVDVYRPILNHLQPEFFGASHGAQGGFTFGGGPTQVRNGPTSNQFNTYSAFLLGLPTAIGKILQVDDRYSVITMAYSGYIRDQWQLSPKVTLSYGTRYEFYPIPRRPDRGLERYDFENNKMLICGVGAVAADCGVSVSNKLFAPRIGVAYRATDTFVLRAGYGITYDALNLARNLRSNYPIILVQNLTGVNSYQPAGSLQTGIPLMQPVDFGNGIIDVPENYAVVSLGDKFERGYVQSWNFTLQKKLAGGFTAQAGYVATRQVRTMGHMDLNVGRVGGGNASRPFNRAFGRSTSTILIAPIGTTKYNSLQTTLERRFSGGFQLQASYTWSKTNGICCADVGTGSPLIMIPEYYDLNRAVLSWDRPHSFSLTGFAELPFGQGRRWLTGGVASKLFSGWQVNGMFIAYSGPPFTVTSSGTSLDAPGNTQRADLVKPEVKKLGGAGRGQSYFDPLAFAPVTQPRFGTAGFNIVRGPGLVNLDCGLFREFRLREGMQIQFRAEALNATNTPHFGNPGANVSNLQLNPDRSIRNLGGFTEITSVRGTGREGIDERVFRLGLRFSF
ncbi:MAG: TonB-dependent receptor [Bryobacteraceae bacterium]|nr:TonB-dependent receptor [Bryobacterales bacterium]MEB2360023.1 TonB-dependent receptor [Bryobacterales bacterium]NUN01378.1 TonB-dependent receptor [Bryobacteraceae bacterium]